MSAMMTTIWLAIAAATPTQTAPPPASCPATPAALPGEMAGWRRMVKLTAGAEAAKAPDLPIGEGARLSLLPASGIDYAVPPPKAGDAASRGGVVSMIAPVAGRYRVALGGGAWVDVVGGGKALASVAHGHGPACSGIRKMVDFDLPAGRYVIQIIGSSSAELPMMVVRLP